MIVGIQVHADYGHFSHPATVYSSLSYPIPPKTTVMGMLGAIMGETDYLFLRDIAYGCCIVRLDGKRNFCFNGVKDALKELSAEKMQGFSKGHKQFYRELLVNPVYEIYCDIGALEVKHQEKLLALLQEGQSLYTLYMGINFCLASYRFLGVFEGAKTEEKAVIDSFVPTSARFFLEPQKHYTDIRFATDIKPNREFGKFCSVIVETTGQGILCEDVPHVFVNNKRVVLV